MGAIISRFAPAPTGFLHLGHVVNALYVWEHADRVLLRIEDHDRQRSRREYETAILEDLRWLGFEWDGPVVRQSERGDIYICALERLRAQQLVYACTCSRDEIAARTVTRMAGPLGPADPPGPEGPGLREDHALRYDGNCRDRGIADTPGISLRVRLEPSIERFVDLRHGPQAQRPSDQCGDLVVRDREGNWTYQFAVTVDDFEQGITHVIRGDDLLDSAGRQIQLARLLGRDTPPTFLHHPLIMKSPTQKLSKSDGATGVRDLRAQGWRAKDVLDKARSLIIAP
ncbi:MAG TPA: glutamate--tRNA ligase family protein [Vicinamibacterales bacterium]|nr:glutamate--tRNA ligase family protein [Vicinamibacterales bacterium]